MRLSELKFHISRDSFMFEGCDIYMAFKRDDGYDVLDLEHITINHIKKHEDGFKTPMRLSDDAAQGLLQALWNSGYRPNNGESSVAHVDSLKYHLEDMRKLVFK